MSLTRKDLSAMGITGDQQDSIIDMHSQTVNALKDEIDKYKTEAEKLPNVQKELDELKATMEGGNAFEEKYNNLKKEYEDFKKDVSDKELTRNKEKAYRELLVKAGISGDKRLDSIMKIADLSKIELDGENIKDSDKLLEGIKEDWSEFITTTKINGANTQTPPQNNGGKMTKQQIMAIKDSTERHQAMMENAELFGLVKE